MTSASQDMLNLTDCPNGISTREIVEIVWPDTFDIKFSTARPALTEELRRLRHESQMSPPMIAERLDWSEDRLKRIESGNVSGRDLKELLSVYNVDDEKIKENMDLALRARRLQHLLAKVRNVLVTHMKQGRVVQCGYAYGAYNNSRSVLWKITPKGRDWINRRTSSRISASTRVVNKIRREHLLLEAQETYGHQRDLISLSVRREISRMLRAEGCTLQSIADIFGVTRETVRQDCKGTTVSDYKLSDEERFTILADRWMKDVWMESNVDRIVGHPAYQEVIEMGKSALPLVLNRMRETNEHWFWALSKITGKDQAQGEKTVTGAIEAWLRWGIEEGYVTV